MNEYILYFLSTRITTIRLQTSSHAFEKLLPLESPFFFRTSTEHLRLNAWTLSARKKKAADLHLNRAPAIACITLGSVNAGFYEIRSLDSSGVKPEFKICCTGCTSIDN